MAFESRAGVSRVLIAWLPAISAVAIMIGWAYTTGQAISDVQGRLDRNCRILATIQADVRFIIVEHTAKRSDAESFREIFKDSAIAAC